MGKRLLALGLLVVAGYAVWNVIDGRQGALFAASSVSIPGELRSESVAPILQEPKARQLVDVPEPLPGELDATDPHDAPLSRVEVYINDAPATVGWIDAYEKPEGWWRRNDLRSTAPVSQPVGPDGSAWFDSPWEFGASLTVRLPGGRPLSHGVLGRDGPPGSSRDVKTHYVQLGTGLIFGRVWDRAGQPAVGVPVLISFPGRLHGANTTDSGGYFEFTDLPAKAYSLRARPDGLQEARVRGDLAVGEHAQVELGSPTGLHAIQGHVIDAFGDPLESVPPEPLGMLGFSAQVGASTAHTSVVVESDGSFELELPSGTYTVWLRIASDGLGVRDVEPSFHVSEAGTRDIVLSGSRVTGVVQMVSRGQRFDPKLDGCITLWLSKVVSDEPAVHQDVCVGRDDRFTFHGVHEGLWTLSSRDLAEEPLTIHVGSEARIIELDLGVRQLVEE